jgi:UDP-N-acetylglucosamine 2-epimerase (non-hydrolysing)
VACGSARLVGTDTANIIEAVSSLLERPELLAAMSEVRHPYGGGDASREIVRVLSESIIS